LKTAGTREKGEKKRFKSQSGGKGVLIGRACEGGVNAGD